MYGEKTREEIVNLYKQGKSKYQIAKELGISTATVYRIIKNTEKPEPTSEQAPEPSPEPTEQIPPPPPTPDLTQQILSMQQNIDNLQAISEKVLQTEQKIAQIEENFNKLISYLKQEKEKTTQQEVRTPQPQPTTPEPEPEQEIQPNNNSTSVGIGIPAQNIQSQPQQINWLEIIQQIVGALQQLRQTFSPQPHIDPLDKIVSDLKRANDIKQLLLGATGSPEQTISQEIDRLNKIIGVFKKAGYQVLPVKTITEEIKEIPKDQLIIE